MISIKITSETLYGSGTYCYVNLCREYSSMAEDGVGFGKPANETSFGARTHPILPHQKHAHAPAHTLENRDAVIGADALTVTHIKPYMTGMPSIEFTESHTALFSCEEFAWFSKCFCGFCLWTTSSNILVTFIFDQWNNVSGYSCFSKCALRLSGDKLTVHPASRSKSGHPNTDDERPLMRTPTH